MNGRIYDPTIARFLSADPTVQSPGNPQTLNRYAYANNNPLTYVDPSGYGWFSSFWKHVLRPILVIAVAITAAWLTLGPAWSFFGSFITSNTLLATATFATAGAVGGFVGGFVGSGGNVQAGINGAISGAIMGAVTGFAGGMGWSAGGTNSVLAHAVGGGVDSVVQGQKFGPGALSAGFMDSFMPRIENIGGTDGVAITKRVVASAVVGGTTSALGGRKFANGADTFGFLRLFGEAALKMRQSMIIQSKLDPRNASKVSVGFNGDGFGLGGGRYDADNPFGPPSPLGGDQGGPGSFFGSPYAPGSLRDYVVEAYGGPHDFLNSGYWYDDIGDVRRGMSNFSRGFGDLLNYTNVVVATPFVAASVGLLYGDPVAESRIAGGW